MGAAEGPARRADASAGAKGQQHFPAQTILEFLEFQRRFALIAEHLEHRRAGFFGYLHVRLVELHHVHLQRLHEELLLISTARTSQPHYDTPQTLDSIGSLFVNATTKIAADVFRQAHTRPETGTAR